MKIGRYQIGTPDGFDWLKSCACNVYSQFGEDGLLRGIFERIGIRHKFFVDVGAADGILFSNTRYWAEQGWSGVCIECDPEAFERLESIATPSVKCLKVQVQATGQNTLDVLLGRFNVPTEFDLFSLDIDGQEFHIMNSMLRYRPRVVVIEHDPNSVGIHTAPLIGADGQASADAIYMLLVGKGYMPVVFTYTNVVGVRSDILEASSGAADAKAG